MVKFELIDPKMRDGLVCARCGRDKSVKYMRNGLTYCNCCAPLMMFVDDDEDEVDEALD